MTEEKKMLRALDLPSHVEASFLQWFFESYEGGVGLVEQVVVERRTDSKGRLICYALVTFGDHETAKRALDESNYVKFDGVSMRLIWGDEETNEIRKSDEGRIFIDGFDPSIEASQVHDAMADHGEVISCRTVTNVNNNSGRAYVQFRSDADAKRAIDALTGASINGRPVQVGIDQYPDLEEDLDISSEIYDIWPPIWECDVGRR